MKKIRVISCITTIMIMALIFFFSSQNSSESSTVSKSVTVVIVKAIVSVFTDDAYKMEIIVNSIHNFIRKMAHFTIYTSLGISTFVMIYSNIKKGRVKTVLYTCLFCAFYAATDEFHQLFIDGRSGNIKDVLIDTSGALTGALICIAILAVFDIIRRRKKKHV